jgi:hypothetical protein
MKKRFVVSTNSSSPEKDSLFIIFLKKNNLLWWHYLANTWLVVDPNGTLSAKDIRGNAREIFQDYNLVLEMTPTSDTWSGFGPSSDKKNMFTWIKKNWKK